MSKYIGSKCKLCRREGEKLFLKGERCFSAKCAIVKRNFPPGMHGAKRKARLTGYGIQLREKQKAKRLYGLLERQFRKYFETARKKKGSTSEVLVKLLEMRFDNVIYRLGFATSRSKARQMIGHGLFTINGRKVNIPSYNVRPNDIIKIKENKAGKKIFENLKDKLKKHETPSWLLLDAKKLEAKVLSGPAGDELKQIFDSKLIVEFYSR
ncbi:30S ribosomal protein S4 [Patescibacteria group bacterium]|nr:30S ribosomal protein S4 [Patescibacteria group bacterium]MBU1922201.1 30S ribosomal protein S4 [Patescibacteria group bacterium]